MNSNPIGSRECPANCQTLLEAVCLAKTMEHKIWARLDGETNMLYEVYPGGRNIRWPIETLRAEC